MAKSFLLAGVEARLRSQREILRRLAQNYEREKQTVQPPFITISRQFGCMAYDMAELLAHRLNETFEAWQFSIYDRKILEMMMEDEGFTTEMINNLSERTRGMIEDWAETLLGGKPPESRVFQRLATTLCSIATLGQAILIGRGGNAITRNIPTGVHVRLIAPVAWRVENLKHYPDRAHEASVAFVKQADRERESFVKRYLGVDSNDPELYHLILNNQFLSMEEQVEIIVKLVQAKYEIA